MVLTLDAPAMTGSSEPMRVMGTPLTMEGAAFRMRHNPPKLGEHTEAVLRELGYDGAKIGRLKAEKVAS
jgi:formyl-CoA transferase